MKGFWDGSNKKDGTSGCGVVTKDVYRGNRVTISTAMAAEVTCACFLTDVRDLIFRSN